MYVFKIAEKNHEPWIHNFQNDIINALRLLHDNFNFHFATLCFVL